MLSISIPGHQELHLEYLVLDYNGTLAHHGQVMKGVKRLLRFLSEQLEIHIVTADTFGTAKKQLRGTPANLSILSATEQDVAKLDYTRRLGPTHTVCIGNGRNDRLMLKEAALGIAVIEKEGAAGDTIISADITCSDIKSALKLLLYPERLKATLRS